MVEPGSNSVLRRWKKKIANYFEERKRKRDIQVLRKQIEELLVTRPVRRNHVLRYSDESIMWFNHDDDYMDRVYAYKLEAAHIFPFQDDSAFLRRAARDGLDAEVRAALHREWSNRADVHANDNEALRLAAANGHYSTVVYLLREWANARALDCAARKGAEAALSRTQDAGMRERLQAIIGCLKHFEVWARPREVEPVPEVWEDEEVEGSNADPSPAAAA